jgi:hypothetical protein
MPLLLQSMLYLGTSVCLFYSTAVCDVPGGCLSCSSLCFTWTYLFNNNLCCARRWPHQLVVHLDCLSTKASAAPRHVSLQELLCAPEVSVDYIEPVLLHFFMSFYKSFVLHLKVSVFKSIRAYAAFVHFCLPELCSAPVLVCSLQEFCAAPGHFCLQESSVCYTWRSTVYTLFCLFCIFSKQVCFGCFDTCSKHRNKPKNIFFGLTKQTEKQPKQIVFRSFRFKPIIYFVCFEYTLF